MPTQFQVKIVAIAAGLLEMVWSYSAKQADGFKHLGWGGLTVVASLASFFLLTFALRSLRSAPPTPSGPASGAVGSFAVGIALPGESAGFWRIASAVLIVAGVIGLRLTSK